MDKKEFNKKVFERMEADLQKDMLVQQDSRTFKSVKTRSGDGDGEKFNTGSVRDSREGRGRFDLVSPIALRRIAKHYENGAKKYKDRNWEKGQPVMRYLDSAESHLAAFKELKLKGKEMDEDHLAAICWNIMAMMHMEDMVAEGFLPEDLIDYPKPNPRIPGRKYRFDPPDLAHQCEHVGCNRLGVHCNCHSEPGEV